MIQAETRDKSKQKTDVSFDKAKFKNLVLYVADKCSDDPDFGATKLNKILLYADFLSYGIFGKPITGATYFRLRNGPAPKQWVRIGNEMQNDGDIVIQVKRRFNKHQHRVLPLLEADLSVFDAKEISLVDEVINALCGCNATQVSLLSHDLLGWQLANDKEDIPYATIFLTDSPLSKYETIHGLELAAKHGWKV